MKLLSAYHVTKRISLRGGMIHW